MKKFGNLFHKITDIENIQLAHTNASRGKKYYKEVIEVNSDVTKYCLIIKDLLETETYKVEPYKIFKKLDKGKYRDLYKLPYFPDRIIQHAIMQIVEPIWKKNLITDTYQAIKGRGVHRCVKKIKKAIFYSDVKYCLQTDVSKFYPSITNDILKSTVRDKIKCVKTLRLLDLIIESSNGVPIGNYISQYFGNLVLSKLDHKIKEIHKVKHYYRYCDDIVILSDDKQKLHELRKTIHNELLALHLSLKPNYQVYKINHMRGVDFLGVVMRKGSIKLRKSIANSFKRVALSKKLENQSALMSYYGWIKLTGAYRLWNKYVRIYKSDMTDTSKLLPLIKEVN